MMPITRYQLLLQMIAEDDGSDSCLEWPFGRATAGYGVCWVSPTEGIRQVHVLSYAIRHGLPLPLPFVVRHSCDNPPCFRGKHLLSGTHADNAQDALNRRRMRMYGEENHQAVLNRAQVEEIRRLRTEERLIEPELARRFGVARPTIADILHRRCWK